MKNRNWLKVLSCSVFATLYLIVAIISLICSTEFFKLAHSGVMSWVLAIGFEIGAMSCLLSTLILPKKKLGLVWFMFIVLTLFQCMGNMYAAFIHLENFSDWIDMFGLTDMEPIGQKRVLAGISGIILPLVALGFIRIMADVLQDGHDIEINEFENDNTEHKMLFGEPLAQDYGSNETKDTQEITKQNIGEMDPPMDPPVDSDIQKQTDVQEKLESETPGLSDKPIELKGDGSTKKETKTHIAEPVVEVVTSEAKPETGQIPTEVMEDPLSEKETGETVKSTNQVDNTTENDQVSKTSINDFLIGDTNNIDDTLGDSSEEIKAEVEQKPSDSKDKKHEPKKINDSMNGFEIG